MNRASKKLRNKYHVKDTNTREDLDKSDKGYINLKRAYLIANAPLVEREPKKKKKKLKVRDSRTISIVGKFYLRLENHNHY